MSITLIGMPSCGKSTIGVLLAKQLGLRFIDTDLLIQEREGRLLHDIIEQDGAESFKKTEAEVCLSVTDRDAVISTGGSAVYSEEAMNHFATLGKIIYIYIPYGEMENRLGDYVHRGVVMPDGYTLRDLYDERAPLYEKAAQIRIESGEDISDTLERILKALEV